jgi:hypothetical protein
MQVVAEAVVWWVVLVLLELVWVSTTDRNELLLAVGGALVAAVGGVIGRRASERRYPFGARDLRPLLRMPAAVVPESLRLASLVLSRTRPIGVWRQRPVPDNALEGDTRTVATAAFVVGQSATPETFVASVERPVAIVHTLRRRGER